MKLTALYTLAIAMAATAFADASTIRIEYKDGNTQFLTEDGIVQEEYFTREQDPQAYCLAENIYFEARSDSVAGQAAVADVVINRMFDSRYPDTICEVVTEGPIRESWKTRQNPDLDDSERVYYPVKHRCQFSWYCDGKSDEIPLYDIDVYRTALIIAQKVFFGSYSTDITKGATHYHADYVFPAWRKQKTKTLVVANHIFYRWEK